MAEVRIAGTVSNSGGANEGRAITALKQLSDDHIAIWGWNCPSAGKGFREIDAIVVCPRGVYVLEAKNWRGPISGNAQDWEWSSETGPLRNKSPIEVVRNRVLSVSDFLRTKLERDDRFLDPDRRKLKIWIEGFVVLLNPTADVHRLVDDRKLQAVIGIEQLDDALFKEAPRQFWAKDLSETEISLIADTIFRPIGDPVVGIDFGTTNSLVAYCNDRGDVELMHVDEDRTLVPSLFTVLDGNNLVGNQVEELLKDYDRARTFGASGALATKPENIVFWIKKLLGKSFDEYANAKEEYPFSVTRRGVDDIGIEVDGRSFSPTQIATELLRYLNGIAGARLSGGSVRAVIPVPVRFNDRQRKTLEACALGAGFTEVTLAIDEATAAALAWTYRSNYSYSGNLAVYDLGGGTFDVSIVEVKHGVVNVKAIRGDEKLGGYHFDLALADYLFHSKLGHGRTLIGMSLKTQYSIRRELERARKRLSKLDQCNVFIHVDGQDDALSFVLTRADLERATGQVLDRTFRLCQEALNAARSAGVDRIDDVILSGGMTHTPFIKQQVKEFFFGSNPKKHPILPSNPSTLVCEGAAIYAGMLMGRVKGARIGERVTPFSYGIDAYKGYPTDKSIYLSVIIERDEKLFDRNGDAQRFTGGNFVTVMDNQYLISSTVLQSSKGKNEKVLASDCLPLGTFSVQIERHPAGKNGINVIFCIDKNGILEAEYFEILNLRNRGIKRFNMLLKNEDNALSAGRNE